MDNHYNDYFENSMDTPRDIPYDPGDWDQLRSRLDEDMPPKRPFPWPWLLLLPLLALVVWQQGQIRNLQQPVKQQIEYTAKIDTIVVTRTLRDTVYKTIYERIPVPEHRATNAYAEIGSTSPGKLTTPTVKLKATDNQTNITESGDNYKQAQLAGSPAETGKKTKDAVPAETNKTQLTAAPENAGEKLPANQTPQLSEPAKDKANEVHVVKARPMTAEEKQAQEALNESRKAETTATANPEQPQKSEPAQQPVATGKTDTKAENAATPLPDLTKPVHRLPASGRISLWLEGGGSLFEREQRKGQLGAGVSIRIAPRWYVNTGLQWNTGTATHFRDKLPDSFPRPKPHQPGDRYKDFGVTSHTLGIPLTVSWYPQLGRSSFHPFVNAGILGQYRLQTEVRYQFERPGSGDYSKVERVDINQPILNGVLGAGVQKMFTERFGIYAQLQYQRSFLDNALKVKSEENSFILSGGLRINL